MNANKEITPGVKQLLLARRAHIMELPDKHCVVPTERAVWLPDGTLCGSHEARCAAPNQHFVVMRHTVRLQHQVPCFQTVAS